MQTRRAIRISYIYVLCVYIWGRGAFFVILPSRVRRCAHARVELGKAWGFLSSFNLGMCLEGASTQSVHNIMAEYIRQNMATPQCCPSVLPVKKQGRPPAPLSPTPDVMVRESAQFCNPRNIFAECSAFCLWIQRLLFVYKSENSIRLRRARRGTEACVLLCVISVLSDDTSCSFTFFVFCFGVVPIL